MPATTLEELCREIEQYHVTLARLLPDRDNQASDTERVEIRPIKVKGKALYQLEYRRGKQAIHSNLAPGAASAEAKKLLLDTLSKAVFHTNLREYSVRRLPDGTLEVSARDAVNRVKPTDHNRQKHRLLPEGTPVPFLVRLGVMNRDGTIASGRYDKFRQINRFLELVEHSLDSAIQRMPTDRPLHVVDFGSGKSYLTFALHHYLTKIREMDVSIIGLDLKADVIAHCESIASELDCVGLHFVVGDINGFVSETNVDIVVSLHACDTATDAALLQAVSWNAGLILAVPCCQHELYPQIKNETNTALLKHGILKERVAALVTDAIRGAWLESEGYSVQVMEFVEMEHTPKNLLIRAVRSGAPTQQAALQLQQLCDAWSVSPYLLENATGETGAS